jgi:alkylation response protein AidB-like acyl-CoA dehydrogenase
MGLHGSSTVSLTFDNVRVPKENLLGKVGDAATIALNILNMGRLELGFIPHTTS